MGLGRALAHAAAGSSLARRRGWREACLLDSGAGWGTSTHIGSGTGLGRALAHTAAGRSSPGRWRGGARPRVRSRGVRAEPDREARTSSVLFFLKSNNTSALASRFFLSSSKPHSSSFSCVSHAYIACPMTPSAEFEGTSSPLGSVVYSQTFSGTKTLVSI